MRKGRREIGLHEEDYEVFHEDEKEAVGLISANACGTVWPGGAVGKDQPDERGGI